MQTIAYKTECVKPMPMPMQVKDKKWNKLGCNNAKSLVSPNLGEHNWKPISQASSQTIRAYNLNTLFYIKLPMLTHIYNRLKLI